MIPRNSIRQRRRFRARLDGHTSAYTTDVGAGGFCIQVHRALPLGTAVMGSLAVDGTEVTFVGRVAWVKPGDMNLNIPSRLGVSFARPPPGLEALIAPARPTVA